MDKNIMKKCCVCGNPATNIIMSIIGQIPFHVCDEHYETLGPDWGRDPSGGNDMVMGLIRKDTGEFVKLPYWGK